MAGAPVLPDLSEVPSDLLAIIASQVPTETWAQLSTTCKTLYQINPTTVKLWLHERVSRANVAAMLRWVNKRMDYVGADRGA